MDNEETKIHINKKQLKRSAGPSTECAKEKESVKKEFSTVQKEFKGAQPNMFKDLKFEILNFGNGDSDAESEATSFTWSEASTSKDSNFNISNLSKLDSEKFKIFLLHNFDLTSRNCKEHLQFYKKLYFTVKNSSDRNDKNFQFSVDKIRSSHDRKSNDEVGNPENLSISENLFSDTNIINSRENSYYKYEKELSSNEPAKEPAEVVPDIKKKTQGLKHQRPRTSVISNANFLFKKARVVSFFSKKQKKKKKKEKNEIKISNVNEKKNDNSEIMQSTFLDPQVTREEDLKTKQQLLDCFIYILYLILITTIALSMVSSNMFYYANITASMFFDAISISRSNYFPNNTFDKENISTLSTLKTLRESKTLDDFWAFADSTMLGVLYWNFYYPRINPAFHKTEDDRKMLYGNQILGVARLRQVRVRNDSCKIHPDVQRFFDACYFYYSVFSEDTKPIKQDMGNTSTATAWIYTEAKQLETSYHWGEISIYGGGGYYLDLSTNKEDSVKLIQELKQNAWISKATRAVFINFNIYNANVNIFCVCKIVLEFPPFGGIIPVADFHALKIIRYLSTFDFFILGCEFLYILFVVYYTLEALRILIRQQFSFFLFFWNHLDMIILTMSYICIILSIVRYIYADRLISTLKDRNNEYTEFNFVKNLQINFNNSIAVLLFFCWIKLFKYFDYNTILLEFRVTLIRSLNDILGFFPMFMTIFLAFAFLAYLLFGNQVKTYDTFWLSFLTLLQAFSGEFYYTDIVESNPILGPIFYMAYIFFLFFVLLNVFIAIINDAYASVKAEVIYDKPRTGEYMKRGLLYIFSCGYALLSKKLRLKKNKKELLFQEIETALKNAGFSTAEIKIFFYKYNINFSNFLEENTKKRIIKDLELKRIDFNETSEQTQINAFRRRLESLANRVEDLEVHLQPVVDKVDILLRRL